MSKRGNATSFRRAALCAFLAAALPRAAAEPPVIHRAEPAAMRPGKTIIRLFGENLSSATSIWASPPLTARIPAPEESTPKPGEVGVEFMVPDNVSSQLAAFCIANPDGVSDFRLLLIDPLPAVEIFATNHRLASAQPLHAPIATAGLARELESHFFQFDARAQERFVIETVSSRIGSEMDPLLRLLDEQGHELAWCEDSPGIGADARIEFQAQAKGRYFIELRDSRFRGGPQYFFRLRLAAALEPIRPLDVPTSLRGLKQVVPELPVGQEMEPNDSPETAQPLPFSGVIQGRFDRPGDRDLYAFTVGKGQRVAVTGRSRTIGSPCDLMLTLLKPDGTLLAESNPTNADDGTVTNHFAEAGKYFLRIEELNHQSGPAHRTKQS